MVCACRVKSVNDWVKSCLKLEIAGKASKGLCRKTWFECVKVDMKDVTCVRLMLKIMHCGR